MQVSYEAGLATVQTYYSNLEFVSSLSGADRITMVGWTLPSFVRIFSILIENAAVHSGITDGRLLLRADARIDAGLLVIGVRNTLSPNADLDRVKRKVNAINEDFGRERASNFIREEGGSGYPKIWKILAHDLGGDHALGVSVVDENEFLVEIMLDTKGILL